MGSDTLYDKGDRFTRLASAGTTTIRTTETRLKRVVLNSFSTSGSVSIYNATSTAAGHLFADISTNAIGGQGTYEYDVVLSGGLTVSIVNTPDVTVIYQ